MKETVNILMLEDDAEDILIVSEHLKKLGYKNVNIVSKTIDFLSVLNKLIHIIILDNKIDGAHGYEVLPKIQEVCPAAVKILLTGCEDANILAKYWNCGVEKYINKNNIKTYLDDLQNALKFAMEKAEANISFYNYLKSQTNDARSV